MRGNSTALNGLLMQTSDPNLLDVSPPTVRLITIPVPGAKQQEIIGNRW